jgi:hypothetical protein
MRKYETLEKSNEELKIEKMDLQAQLKDKEDQMNCFSSMVVETKETKNKEISELENRLTDYENKLFVRSKENVVPINLRRTSSLFES